MNQFFSGFMILLGMLCLVACSSRQEPESEVMVEQAGYVTPEADTHEETVRLQEEIIKRQEEELKRQEKEIQDLKRQRYYNKTQKPYGK